MVVQDVDRPDINGVYPKMFPICEQVKQTLVPTPHMNIYTNDNIMSSVMIVGSLDARENWINGIYENSRYFRFDIKPMNGKRYYDVTDDKVTVELTCKYTLSKFRKYTGPVNKVIAKIQEWIDSNNRVS